LNYLSRENRDFTFNQLFEKILLGIEIWVNQKDNGKVSRGRGTARKVIF